MNVTLKQLKAFVELAGSKSYATASERLSLSQPALSICIKNLETEVGGTLFSRTTRSVELTPEGHAFYPKARKLLLDWFDTFEAVNEMFTLQQGRITVSVMPSFASSLLPPVLKQYNQQYPNIRIDVIDVVMEAVIASVKKGEAELGIVFEPDKLVELEFIPLLQNDFVAVMHPEHSLAEKTSLTITEFAGHAMVMMNRGSSLRLWLEQVFQGQSIAPSIAAEAWQLDTLGEMVKVNLGLSIVPGLCKTQMLRKDLVCVPVIDSGLVRKVGIIQRADASLSASANALRQLLLAMLRAEK
ncbi:LysR family transcriptional regulator [Planctobacterium marinum]|uniref:Transcriptional regulator n=1 Tax=Planctobacterium marinum TaxID=1631968 RepID=A0AA48KUI0_9ALTE|nr:transcriptional regulator [Planctobacterium marinum]